MSDEASGTENDCENGTMWVAKSWKDLGFVTLYYAETARRCADGIQWEGWLVLKDLTLLGYGGPQADVYRRGKS